LPAAFWIPDSVPWRRVLVPLRIQRPGVLVVVAVEAEQHPVAAILGIVVVVVVLVMDRQFVHVGVVELACASPADPRIQFQRLAAIALVTFRTCTLRIRNDAVESREIRLDLLPRYHAVHPPSTAQIAPVT